MHRKSGLICITLSVFLYAFIRPVNNTGQENQLPVVKIVSPKAHSYFDYNTQINYEISVVDKEDGNSKYDEINAKEVVLEVRWLAGTAKMNGIINTGVKNDPPGLALMRSSNCFNCHNFKSRSIGPSFDDIAAKYPPTIATADTMVKRIRKGSSGIWGRDAMPTHPALTLEETKSIVEWILQTAEDHTVDYYIGLTGSFRIKPPAAPNKKVNYYIIASYTDHGLKNIPGHHSKAQDVAQIFLRK